MDEISIEDLSLILSHYQSSPLKNKWIYLLDSLKDEQVSHLKQSEYRAIKQFIQEFPLQECKDALHQTEVTWLPFCSHEFPENLLHCYDPPLGLFIQGKGKFLQTKQLSIVGSRQNSQYGKQILEELIPPLVAEGFTIVSGLAHGIDTLAHQLTRQSGGKTIGVIGTGIGQVYPKANRQLQANMGQEDLLVSEYPLDSPAHKSHFPMRNRIIASLSLGTLVVEAKYRSGSLITANIALNEGKEVFAVPGSIFHDLASGTNDLIKHGAVCVLSAQDIISAFEFS